MFDSGYEQGGTGLSQEIAKVFEGQREFFATGATRDLDFRLNALRKLEQAIRAREKDLAAAVREDLGKSRAEFFMTEVGLVLAEIREHKRKLRRWARPIKVRTSVLHFIGRSSVRFEPYGQVLIISPCNYPFNLRS